MLLRRSYTPRCRWDGFECAVGLWQHALLTKVGVARLQHVILGGWALGVTKPTPFSRMSGDSELYEKSLNCCSFKKR